MNRLWQIISTVLGAISVLFYVSSKSKDRKIEKHKDEADRYKSQADQERFKASEERKTKHAHDNVRSASESDIDSMLNKQGALRDRLSED